jgi:putative salt-induced outer membrane protein YdiY
MDFKQYFLKPATLAFIFLMLFFFQAKSQLVNVEKDRKDRKEGFVGSASLSLTLTQNTKQIFQGNNQIGVQYHKNTHTLLLLNNLGYMRVDGSNLINNGFQHLRYNYQFKPEWLEFEAFTQHQYNTIRLLRQRFLLGAGPRLKVIETDKFTLFFAPLVMYEHEKLTDELRPQTDKFKGDFILSATLELNERIFFSHVTYYQPDFAAFNEYRLASDSRIQLKFTEKFSFEIILDLLYDSHPPGDIPNTFYTLKNGLKYSF